MATRKSKAPSRVELRKAAEAAEKQEAEEAKDTKTAKKTVKKAVKKKAVRRKSTKKKAVASHRLRMTWGVFDNSAQQIASFPLADRAAADKKASDMTEKGRGTYFVQRVKEPILEEPEETEVKAEE